MFLIVIFFRLESVVIFLVGLQFFFHGTVFEIVSAIGCSWKWLSIVVYGLMSISIEIICVLSGRAVFVFVWIRV